MCLFSICVVKKDDIVKIGFYLRDFSNGGVEMMTLRSAVELQQRGFDVVIIVNSNAGEMASLFIQYFEVISLNLPRDMRTLKGVGSLLKAPLKLKLVCMSEKIKFLVSSKEQVNLINVFANSFLYSGTKSICYRHVPLDDSAGKDYGLFTHIMYKTVLRKADLLVGVSCKIVEQLKKKVGGSVRCEFIPNPVITEDLLEKSNDTGFAKEFLAWDGIRLLVVGRLTYQKGIDVLLNSLSQVRDDVGLFIIGEGESKEELTELSIKLGLGDRVFFLGFDENPYKYMRQADIFVLPSRYEGMPTVLIEAVYLNGSCLAANCPTGPEEIVVMCGSGELFKVSDYDDLRDKIESQIERGKSIDFKPGGASPFTVKASVDQLLYCLNKV